jgi:hypothetical protein
MGAIQGDAAQEALVSRMTMAMTRRRASRSGRRAMALVLVLALVLLCAFFTGVFFLLASGETDRTAAQSREIQATVLGEGVSARLTAMVSQHPWKDRFYKQLARAGAEGAAAYSFTHRTFPFRHDQGAFRTGDLSFFGTIADLPAPRSYRIKLEVTAHGQRVTMVWDKVYPYSLLGVAGEDASTLASHPSPESRDRIDQLIDGIRSAARGNRGGGELREGDIGRQVDEALTDRRSDRNPGRQLFGGRP